MRRCVRQGRVRGYKRKNPNSEASDSETDTSAMGHQLKLKNQKKAVLNPVRAKVDGDEFLTSRYVSGIMPDMSTVVEANEKPPSVASCKRGQLRSADTDGKRNGRETPSRLTDNQRRKASPEDTCVVQWAPPGHQARLLPMGTILRRPPGLLVQQIALVIHESPSQKLRVTDIYEALKNKYPFYRFVDAAAQSSWKSSVRHALCQKWFLKAVSSRKEKGTFWCLNYNRRPADWLMPKKVEQSQTTEDKIIFAGMLGLIPTSSATSQLRKSLELLSSQTRVAAANTSQPPLNGSQSQEQPSTSSMPPLIPAQPNVPPPMPKSKSRRVSTLAPARRVPTSAVVHDSFNETSNINHPETSGNAQQHLRTSIHGRVSEDGAAIATRTRARAESGVGDEATTKQQSRPQRLFMEEPPKNVGRVLAPRRSITAGGADLYKISSESNARVRSERTPALDRFRSSRLPFGNEDPARPLATPRCPLLIEEARLPPTCASFEQLYSQQQPLSRMVRPVPQQQLPPKLQQEQVSRQEQPLREHYCNLRRKVSRPQCGHFNPRQEPKQQKQPLSTLQGRTSQLEKPDSCQELEPQQKPPPMVRPELFSKYEQQESRRCWRQEHDVTRDQWLPRRELTPPQQQPLPAHVSRPGHYDTAEIEVDGIRINGTPYTMRRARLSADKPHTILVECYPKVGHPVRLPSLSASSSFLRDLNWPTPPHSPDTMPLDYRCSQLP